MRRGLLLGAATLRELSARLASPCPTSGQFATLIDPQHDMWERTRTRLSIRKLHSHHGFELPDFLQGSQHAYCVCSELIQRKCWPELYSLLSPTYHRTVTQTFNAHVDPDIHAQDPICILEALLTKARTSGSDHALASLEVRFRAIQTVTFDDLAMYGSEAAPLLGRSSLQESKWTFERCLSSDAAAMGWKVTKIKWRVCAGQSS